MQQALDLSLSENASLRDLNDRNLRSSAAVEEARAALALEKTDSAFKVGAYVNIHMRALLLCG